VEIFLVRQIQPFYKEKIKAARLAQQAFNVIQEEKLRRGIPTDLEGDPANSGLIGVLLSPVTTNPGHLPAKQTSINPNFAAVVVHLLKRAGVEKDDVVAVGFSGSFPAINIAVLAALQTLEVKPIIISSVGASQWGANIPEFMWPDIEQLLFNKRVFTIRSAAGSRGGIDDVGLGLSKQGRALLDDSLTRNNTPNLSVKNYEEGVEKRMALFNEQAGDAEIKVYINAGGGTTSVGTVVGKKMFQPGLNLYPPRAANTIDAVMTRLAEEGVPIIHMSHIDEIAQKYGLPLQPASIPSVGEGKIFVREVHNRWLAGVILAAILLMLYVLIRLDWGYRVLTPTRSDAKASRPEQMV
jgi:poly-gamma-glutamate system protein